ncbi:hypothetical protein PMIN06_002532 [Paraphaeosphaeria minitans]
MAQKECWTPAGSPDRQTESKQEASKNERKDDPLCDNTKRNETIPIQSNPVQSSPIQSNPVQSKPCAAIPRPRPRLPRSIAQDRRPHDTARRSMTTRTISHLILLSAITGNLGP